ncbi:hypothetical protein D3C87_1432960 [compost metagenome]
MLDLRRMAASFQAQSFYKMVAERHPILFRISHVVRVKVTGRTAEFRRMRDFIKHFELAFQTLHKNQEFLTHPCRRRRLPVRECEHRYIFPFDGHPFQHKQHLTEQWLDLPLHRIFKRQWDRRVVDILRSKAEVDKFLI